MSKTSVEIDRDIAEQAAAILGSVTLRDTINASLLEIVNAKRRLELVSLLTEADRFDFEATDHAWGGNQNSASALGVSTTTGQGHEWIVARGTAD